MDLFCLHINENISKNLIDRIYFNGRKNLIKRCINNLIDNAIKYSNKNPEIIIETSEMEGFLYLNISDNGIGIAEEHIQNVKNKFFRVPTGKVHNVKGFGLGLYYVSQVCKAHNWRWEVKSEKGKGTSVLFKIKH